MEKKKKNHTKTDSKSTLHSIKPKRTTNGQYTWKNPTTASLSN